MSENPPATAPESAAPPATAPVISVRGLVKSFGGRRALDGVDLDVAPGEVVTVLGPSGCGKSTLLRCIDALEPVDAGEVTVAGEPMAGDDRHLAVMRRRIGMVFQSYDLFPHRTVLDNVCLAPRKALGLGRREAEARARSLLARVGLEDRADALPRELSGGQQQRVAIVRALAMGPEALLLDEVTAALDPEMVHEVLSVVADLARSGTTMVVVTHELAFARAVADRVVFMDCGRVVEEAAPADFFERPATERARRFLATFSYGFPADDR